VPARAVVDDVSDDDSESVPVSEVSVDVVFTIDVVFTVDVEFNGDVVFNDMSLVDKDRPALRTLLRARGVRVSDRIINSHVRGKAPIPQVCLQSRFDSVARAPDTPAKRPRTHTAIRQRSEYRKE
jgi:hypothetical protein